MQVTTSMNVRASFPIGTQPLCLLAIFLVVPAVAIEWQPRSEGRVALDGSKPSSRLAPGLDLTALPLSFEADEGKTPDDVKFLARGPGYNLLLSPTQMTLALPRSREPGLRTATDPVADLMGCSEVTAVSMRWVDANGAPTMVGLVELPGKVNYLRGNCPKLWRTNIPTFAKVKYSGIYPGVDLILYGNQSELEYDFVIAPGHDPKIISLDFHGAEKLAIDQQGNLNIQIAGGELVQHAPQAYQVREGVRQSILARYVLRNSTSAESAAGIPLVGFEVGAHDPALPLVIDPVLSYSSYLGGSDGDYGYAIALGSGGEIFLTGRTFSTNFPAVDSLQILNKNGGRGPTDVFVTKLNPSGSAVIYSTYLGGTGDDEGKGIAVDDAGSAYLTGFTASSDFPTVNPIQPFNAGGTSDAFVAKLGPSGCTLVYSTYLGGGGIDQGNAVAVDAAGNAFVTGFTGSSGFPTTNAFQSTRGGSFGRDAFVTKINPAGSAMVYSTFLGGSGFDQGIGIAVDSAGEACVTGSTDSSFDFPVFPLGNPLLPYGGAGDAFVTKFNPTGSALVFSTYLGGSDIELGTGIAADLAGNVYVTGTTLSTDFPTTNAYQSLSGGGYDAFVTMIDSNAISVVYATYLGGNSDENVTPLVAGLGGIAVDGAGNAYVTGATTSTNFPLTTPLQAAYGGGGSDAFVAKLNSSGSVTFSSYLGGSGDDVGWGIAVDAASNIFLAGQTISTNFPLINPLLPTLRGGTDAFIAKIANSLPATRTLSGSTWSSVGPAPVASGQAPTCQPVSGRITGVAAHPTDTNIIYIAAASGGVWKTTNGGASWTPLTDGQATLMMGAVALAPSNPNIIYAGTGESTGYGTPPFAFFLFGRGLLKSTDGGAAWTLLGTSQFDRHTMTKIVVHPTDPNTVYVAVAPGELNGLSGNADIWKSIDGGTNWSNTTASLPGTNAFSDLLIDPSDSQILYAAVGNAAGAPANSVYKTVNGGALWTVAGNFPMGTNLGDIKLAIAKSTPLTLYAAIVAPLIHGNFGTFQNFPFTTGLYKMMKTTDGGTTWTELTGTPNYLYPQGFFCSALAVSPTNGNIVYAGGVARFGPNTNGFLLSTNGGLNWTDISIGADGNSIHGDAQAMTFDPNNRLLLGDDGGLWRLDNSVPGNIRWTDLNANLGTLQLIGIALHPTNLDLAYGGLQDNGTVKFDGTSRWNPIRGGDGGFVRVDPGNPYVVYHTYFGLSLERSDDGGVTWAPKTAGFYPDTSNFYPPYMLDPSNPARLLFGTDSIYESLDRGDSWALVTIPFFYGWNTDAVIDSIAIAKTDANTIYASAGGHIFASIDDGFNWTQRDVPGVADNIQDLLVDPANSEIIYAVRARMGNGHVFRSINGGQNWSNLSGNLPDLPVYTIQLDSRFNPPKVFIGNYNGVYVSADSGTSWSRFGAGLPNALVIDLEMNIDLGVLAAGTFGRGMWEIGINFIPAPTLNIQRSGAITVILSWPASATNFTLQTTPQLSPPNWAVVTNAAVPSGNQLSVTLPVSSTTRFFRLQQQ
ncbi:MAG: SBBP repeat-containing protein [Verrucomicrobia bacterium]|nr:SBBP repeat-containing protein [Verrucomicrobiota bacterium]